MSQIATAPGSDLDEFQAPGYADLKQFQAVLSNDDVEMALISGLNNFSICRKCHVEKVQMPDGSFMCPHCNALMGRCVSCKRSKPVFLKICEQCRTDAKDAAERLKLWGERRGKMVNFFKAHCEDMGKCIAIFALVAIAICLLIPLLYQVEHLVEMGEKLAEDVEGGVAPILDEGGRILGYAGRNTASALRILETPLNFTNAVMEDAETIVSKVLDAVSNPRAAFMAYNRVTGTTIICDDGSEYSWKPLVARDGIVTNPYSGCVLHQTKLNGEDKARFFPEAAPQKGDRIMDEHAIAVPPFRPRDLGPSYFDENGGHYPWEGIKVGKDVGGK